MTGAPAVWRLLYLVCLNDLSAKVKLASTFCTIPFWQKALHPDATWLDRFMDYTVILFGNIIESMEIVE